MSVGATDLEMRLRALATEIDYPDTPDLVAVVRSGIAEAPRRIVRPRPWPAIAIGVAALLVAGVIVIPPRGRPWPTSSGSGGSR